jgi:Na+/citrate or Na+/malate symporter
MVTLSTVGYGGKSRTLKRINGEGIVLISSFYSSVDITPRTEGSRVVMMTLIVVSLAVLPSLLADVARTLQKRNGKYKSNGRLFDR